MISKNITRAENVSRCLKMKLQTTHLKNRTLEMCCMVLISEISIIVNSLQCHFDIILLKSFRELFSHSVGPNCFSTTNKCPGRQMKQLSSNKAIYFSCDIRSRIDRYDKLYLSR